MLSGAAKISSLEEEKKSLKEQLEAVQAKLEKAEQKRNGFKERLGDFEVHYRKVIESTMRHEARYVEIEHEFSQKVANVKRKLSFHISKEQKIRTLTDTIKIAIQQSKLEMGNSKMSRATILRARLTKLVNTFENIFGGVVLIGALNIPENSSLGLMKDQSRKFLPIIFSKTARVLAKEMGMMSRNLPVLDRSPISQYVIDSREPYFPNIALLRLPSNHFEVKKALFVPIVVDGRPMGLAGFGNGTYDAQDAQIIMEILTTAWISVISEAMKDSQVTQTIFSNTLPPHIIERVMAYELESQSWTDRSGPGSNRDNTNSEPSQIIIADTYHSATIIFCDIVGFTRRSSQLTPEQVVSFLNMFFSAIDTMVEDRKLEKIKTIGDCYMVACGIPNKDPAHAELAADFALDVMDLAHDYELGDSPIELRIGMHSGPIVAGVIGRTKLTYDVWGDTVNKASRMESTGTPGCIQITAETFRLIDGNPKFILESRGLVNVQGIGNMNTYFLKRNAEAEVIKEKRSPIKPPNDVAILPLNIPEQLDPSDSFDARNPEMKSPIPDKFKDQPPPKLPVIAQVKKGRKASFSLS